MTHAMLWMTARPFEHCLPKFHTADCDGVDHQMRLAKQEAALNDAIATVRRLMPVQQYDIDELIRGLDISEGAQAVGPVQGSQGGGQIPCPGGFFEPVAARRGRRDEDEAVPLEFAKQPNPSIIPFGKPAAMPGASTASSALFRLPLRLQYFTANVGLSSGLLPRRS